MEWLVPVIFAAALCQLRHHRECCALFCPTVPYQWHSDPGSTSFSFFPRQTLLTCWDSLCTQTGPALLLAVLLLAACNGVDPKRQARHRSEPVTEHVRRPDVATALRATERRLLCLERCNQHSFQIFRMELFPYHLHPFATIVFAILIPSP